MGGFKIAPRHIWALLRSLAHGPKMGVQLAPPNGPMWGQLPIVEFWAREGEWPTGKVGDGQWLHWLPEGGDGQWVHGLS